MNRNRLVTSFDPVDFLDTPEMVREYVRQTLEEEGLEGLNRAPIVIARAKDMQAIAEPAELNRQDLVR